MFPDAIDVIEMIPGGDEELDIIEVKRDVSRSHLKAQSESAVYTPHSVPAPMHFETTGGEFGELEVPDFFMICRVNSFFLNVLGIIFKEANLKTIMETLWS